MHQEFRAVIKCCRNLGETKCLLGGTLPFKPFEICALQQDSRFVSICNIILWTHALALLFYGNNRHASS